MRSISDIHRELGCGRNTIYPVIEAAGVEPTLEGLAKMFTDEDFQKIQEAYILLAIQIGKGKQLLGTF